MAEVIYKDIAGIKKNNLDISNIDAIEGFIGTKKYEEISSGKFHDDWFEYLGRPILSLLMFFCDSNVRRQRLRSPALTPTQVWLPEKPQSISPARKTLIFHWFL